MIKKLLPLLLLTASAFAGTVRLYNDSPYKLRAVIRGNDGSYLGEMVIQPEHASTWSSTWDYQANTSNTTLTPYVVYWTCLDGGNFGVKTNVASGALISAESSDGPRYCKPPPKKKQGEAGGPSVEDEQLHHQNEAPTP